MQYTSAFLVAAFAATNILAHGVITEVKGANGVVMPGLTVIDGTPRDCPSAGCGAQADTAIIRTAELGGARASALGRTSGGGPVDGAKMMAVFMNGAAGNTTAAKAARAVHYAKRLIQSRAPAAAGGGVKSKAGDKETGVAASQGVGASNGLPTTDASGKISMTIHQCNQDGAGPFSAQIDPTSGGKDVAAFKTAAVTKNVPGIAAGFSAATTTDFPVEVQMPAGMVCSGSMAGATNVCVVRMQNATPAGPFGGAACFTQSNAAKKRAIEYNIAKRMVARAERKRQLAGGVDEDDLVEQFLSSIGQ